jgi:uncharacterized protein YqgC (DUF456 family)
MCLSFSGFTVVFLFYFLLGFKGKNLNALKSKGILFLSGLVFLSAICAIAFDSDFFLEWDIYHFLIASFFIFIFLKNKLKGSSYQICFWLLLACTPFWAFEYRGFGSDVLFGDCVEGTGMWPLMPGLFFLFFAYTLGAFAKEKREALGFKWSLAIVGLSLVGLAVVSSQYFRLTPLGSDFGCYVHRPPVWVWITTVLSFGGLFLGACNAKINDLALIKRLSEPLSRYEWNKNFGLCYLTHWGFLLILYLNRGFFVENPGTFFAAPFLVILITELTVKYGLKLVNKRTMNSL